MELTIPIVTISTALMDCAKRIITRGILCNKSRIQWNVHQYHKKTCGCPDSGRVNLCSWPDIFEAFHQNFLVFIHCRQHSCKSYCVLDERCGHIFSRHLLQHSCSLWRATEKWHLNRRKSISVVISIMCISWTYFLMPSVAPHITLGPTRLCCVQSITICFSYQVNKLHLIALKALWK